MESAAVGNVVFVSGCAARAGDGAVPAGVEEQVARALENTVGALEGAGSRLANVVKTFFVITSLDDYGSVRRTETEFYEANAPQLVTTPPAATLMVVPSLGDPALRVQYEVVAARDRELAAEPVTYYPEYWAGTELAYPHVPKEHPKFARSQSIGNLLLVSGCQALDHETVRVETTDFAEQTGIVLGKVRVAVEETGGSLANVLKTNVFVKDESMVAVYREIEQAFLREHAPPVAAAPPASTVLVMSELPRPEFLVEVEAFAVADAAVPGWSPVRQPGTSVAAESAAAGRLVFVSACQGESAPAALEHLGAALRRAGSDIDHVVRLTVAHTAALDHDGVRKAIRCLSEPAPPATFMVVPAIAGGGRCQIDAIARAGDSPV